MAESQDQHPSGEEPEEAGSTSPVELERDTAASSPYRNLFVPLVIVPALIVFSLVLIFALFGQIAGDVKSISQNLQRVQFAGANERDQALYHLVQQLEENWENLQDGEELRWPVEGDIATELGRVWDKTSEDDVHFRYVLAAALTQLGAPGGLDKLAASLEIDPEWDNKGTVRFNALVGLGVAGGDQAPQDIARIVESVLPFLEGPDPGLRLAAAGALQNLPGPASLLGLKSLLGDGALELRGQAAISLSHLGDASGADVLWELVDRGSYDRARQANPEKFKRESMVMAIRERAVTALARLGRPEDLSRLEELAADESDLLVREAALRGLETLAEQGFR